MRETILKCPPKSSEADPIPTSLLREMINEIVPLLAKLFNASLSSGLVPSAFKGAKVRPLLKKNGPRPKRVQKLPAGLEFAFSLENT